MKLFIALLLLLVSCPAVAKPPAQHPEIAWHDAALHEVVEKFRTSILDKDKQRFMELFVPGQVTWQTVSGDQTLRRHREKDPGATKTTFDESRTHESFIDGIVATSASTEEKFGDIRIDSDGDIASVMFGYSFHRDGRETNHGDEAWLLVRTDDGWRITSVIWSTNAPDLAGGRR